MSIRYPSACRLCRAAGEKLFLKGERCFSPKCAMTRRPYPAGQHGEGRRGKVSDYGKQLAEKQKARRIYNLNERQMRRVYEQASKSKSNTGEVLLQTLESKLDNVLYRVGVADSRRHATQIILHGFVKINGRRVAAPSYFAKAGDRIEITKNINSNPDVAAKKVETPSWLEIDTKDKSIKIIARPIRDQIATTIEEQLIVEYYSRLV